MFNLILTKLLMWQRWCERRKKIRLIVMIATDNKVF